jgi:diaminopimelate decarboxylase
MIAVKDLKTPTYLFDREAFKYNACKIIANVRELYPNFEIGYSYKTNYYDQFLMQAKELSLFAEIVSPQEFDLACKYGNHVNRIIYNGVIDDFTNKLAVAMYGGIVNVENIAEFRKFVEYSAKLQLTINLGIRVNFDVGNGLVSRFGIDIESEDFEWIANPRNRPFVSIKCVHFHLGGARSPEYFRARVKKTVEIARLLGASIVDIGGNIYGRMDDYFKSQLPFVAPTTEEVCFAIGDEMAKQCPERDLLLIAECGSPIVSDAMHLLTTITNVNHVRGNTFITCDCRNEDIGWSITKYDPSHQHFGEKYIGRERCSCMRLRM